MAAQLRTRLGVESLGDRIVPAYWAYYGTDLGDASDPANWAYSAPPGYGEDVFVPAGTGGIDARSLDTIGLWVIDPGWNKTWLTDGLTVTAGGDVNDATIRMLGDVDIRGAILLGNVLFFNLPLQPKEVFLKDATAKANMTNTYDGTVHVSTDGTYTLEANSTVRLAANTRFNNEGRVVFKDSAQVSGDGSTFENHGTVTVEKGTGSFGSLVRNHRQMVALGGPDPGTFSFNARVLLFPSGLEVSAVSSGGTWTLRGGGTALSTTAALLSQNDHWNFFRNPTATQNGNAIRIFGDLALTHSVVQFRETPASAGDLRIDHQGNLSLTSTTVGVNLNWTKNSIDSWRAPRITIDSGILVLAVHAEPTPIPGRIWDVFLSPNAITGDFGFYFHSPNYGHGFDTDRQVLRIST
jgi:hypothetical protein